VRRLLPVALVLAALAPACRSARPVGDPTAILLAQQSAWNRGDLEAFMALGYWRSGDLTFFSGGEVTRGYEATLARYRRRYASAGAEMGRLAFRDVETVWADEAVAVVRGRWELDFATQPDAGGLFTLVLRRTSDGWRIVHDHTSSAAP
jgi:ketosteroid isomerase-like protein